MNLTDKIAIVTGSSKGIGLETAKLLLNKGVSVAGWSRSKTLIDHPNFISVQVDVGNSDDVVRAFGETIQLLGEEISILINNAGLGFESEFDKLDEEKWHLMFRTNVDSIFYCSRLVIPQMKAMNEGHIVNISSIAGTNGIAGMAAYCGTKHAVRGISHSMFKELRNFGIKVSTIYPGSTNTNFFDEFSSVDSNNNMMMPEDIALTIIQVLESSANYLPVDIEVRPLQPKGKQ
jgi:NADP-dependent 3-hydroxy acid dehydrogenase YdfG